MKGTILDAEKHIGFMMFYANFVSLGKAEMRARIHRETILLYGLDLEKEKGKAICRLAEQMGMKTVQLQEKDLSQTIGYLAEIPGYEQIEVENTEAETTDGELLAFYGLSDAHLNMFLSKYKEAGIPPVSLKAVVTEHNRNWKLLQLFQELQKEHTLFGRFNMLQQLMKQAEQLPGEKRDALNAVMERCSNALQEEEPNIEELDILIAKMREFLG